MQKPSVRISNEEKVFELLRAIRQNSAMTRNTINEGEIKMITVINSSDYTK